MSSPTLRVLIDAPVHPPALDALRKQNQLRLTIAPDNELEKRHELPEAMIRDVEVVFSAFLPLNHQVMERLRWIQLTSAGYEQLIGADLPGRGARACNAAGVFDIPIAEWNVAMMVNLARGLPEMFRNQQRGLWTRQNPVYQTSLHGKTVGLWGYGGIGRQTARLAKALGMRVHVLTRDGHAAPRPLHYVVPGTGDPEGKLPDRVFSDSQRMAFLQDLDFLVLTMPLTNQTEGIVGEAELRALPARACLLNPARGPLVREQALLRALREGWITAAALDAHYHYPMPPDHPLWSMPNVIMTPHISGSGAGEYYKPRVWEIFTVNLDRFLAGQPLLNELPAERLAGPAIRHQH